jgi:ferrous iron transport protein B
VPKDIVIALAGNPNVGKSTLFNQLTGLRQHTGNWPGKTVALARGTLEHSGRQMTLYDLPGAYSLAARSGEEEVARDFLLSGMADGVVAVCDATCLKRNLNLALQILEIDQDTIVCINLMDEAERQGIKIDLTQLAGMLGVPVVAVSARGRRGLTALSKQMAQLGAAGGGGLRATYPQPIESAIRRVEAAFPADAASAVSPRWAALRLIEDDPAFKDHPALASFLTPEALKAAAGARAQLEKDGYGRAALAAAVVEALYKTADEICARCVQSGGGESFRRQLAVDRLVTGRALGIPLMLLLLALVFYLTIVGANHPSAWLFALFERSRAALERALPINFASSLIVDGIYRVTAWVVSVMLPPMAIFFPLFTLLEDSGYLPRVSFNLDGAFARCGACGKQSLTLMMGIGCNAAGVIGCRIIDSPRERLIAILTNAMIPCNGRFPSMMMLLGVLFAASRYPAALSALGLTAVIALGVAATLATSRLLSSTLLRGIPSALTLELPPYRRPELGKVLVRSLLDRTVYVLARALVVAVPAGAILFLMANIRTGGVNLVERMAAALHPLGRLLGMDGMLLTAFILGFPANEIVLPIAAMGYLSAGTLTEAQSLTALWGVLEQNGWSALTIVCFLIFSLLHWPCSTTCLTIWRETRSFKWTLTAIALPTVLGMALCALTAFIWRCFL